MEQSDLIKACLDGNDEACAELVSLHRPLIYRHCLALVKDEGLAEDMTQEAFLKAFAHLTEFRQEARFSTWLWRIAHNLCLDLLKKKGAHEMALCEELAPAIQEEGFDPELHEKIIEHLDVLSERHRIVFEMYVFDKIPQKQIAAMLNIPHGTVRSRFHYAKRKLRERLDYDFFTET